MAHSSPTTRKQPQIVIRRASASSVLFLARWRLRRTWGMLLVTCLGMIAAVMIICTGPLYSNVALTAGLRGVITATPENSSVIIYSNSDLYDNHYVDGVSAAVTSEVQTYLGKYVTRPHLSIESPKTKIVAEDGRAITPVDDMTLITEPMNQVGAHLRLLQGRLPRTLSPAEVRRQVTHKGAEIEIALTDNEARQRNVHPGSVLSIVYTFEYFDMNGTRVKATRMLNMHIVGIFASTYQRQSLDHDPFWHGRDYRFISHAGLGPAAVGADYMGLASTETFATIFTEFSSQLPSTITPAALTQTLNLFWLYQLVPQRITIDDLNSIVDSVQQVQLDISNHATTSQVPLEHPPYVHGTQIFLPSDILAHYQARVPIVRIPAMSLLVLEVALVLFFVMMMSELLVDRQAEAIAVLRSRGISRTQVFGAFGLQALGLGLIALLAGPLLAMLLAQLLARTLLPSGDGNALDLVTGNPLPIVLSVRWYGLVAAGVAILTMLFAVSRAIRVDILALRREMARSTQVPFWRRLNLDIMALVVMVVGYSVSVYLVNSDFLDNRTRQLLLAPLTVVGAVFLLLACVLLFLRLFPRLLAGGAHLAARNRGAAPVLAVAQMARAPRQPVRMTLLLALASAFAIFSLVFISSQAQRVQDIVAYQGGADFSGAPVIASTASELRQQTQAYRQIPGVQAVSLGFAGIGFLQQDVPVPVALRAVDTSDFAQAAIWTQQGTDPTLASMMSQLSAQREAAIQRNVVPAVVDQAMARALHLAPGSRFVLSTTSTAGSPAISTTFVDLIEVSAIPGAQGNQLGSAQVPVGGMIVDYQTYASVFSVPAQAAGSDGIPLNYAWVSSLKTSAALNSVRLRLGSGDLQLTPLYDRLAQISSLQYEPLFLDLIGILIVGAATALLLALVGNLLTSWLSARGRITSFAVLRALGTTPRQVASVLVWEQGIVYTAAILLGVVFGALLALIIVPALVFTGVPTSGTGSDVSNVAFYVSQSVPPIQVIFSPLLIGALGALIVFCVLALWLMVRVVTHPSMSQSLRLNED